jgi:predicted nucleic acid-binding protein
VVVVDASALAAVVFDDERASWVVARLTGEALHVPSLFHLEMTNATLSRCRRTPALTERFVAGLGRVLSMSITIHGVDPLAVFALAVETGLTAYDAAYLRLSRDLGAPLVTLDKQLLAAARRQ